jgi:putative endonuclease
MAWVYILQGASGRYYIGSTDNLARRFQEHSRGRNHTTARFGGGVRLVAQREMPSIPEARKLERELKRKEKPEVVSANYKLLIGLRAAPKAFGVGCGFESHPTQILS